MLYAIPDGVVESYLDTCVNYPPTMLSYVFLMQYTSSQSQFSDTEANRMKIMTQIGGAVTMIGCVLNLCLLCLLPLKSEGFFIIGNMCVVLMAAQLSLLGSENANFPDPIMCKLASCLIQYFFLCVHCASLAYALYLWSRFGPSCLTSCRRNGVYLLVIWCVPVIFVLGAVITADERFGKGDSCWLPDGPSRLWFLIPVYVLLTANFVLYVLICRYSMYMSTNRPGHTTSKFKQLAMTSLSLKPVFGQAWFLGMAVTLNGPVFLQYLYVALASTQGMLVLVFHVLTHGQIQKALCEKVAVRPSELSSETSGGRNTGHSVMRAEPSDNPNNAMAGSKSPKTTRPGAPMVPHSSPNFLTPSSPNKTCTTRACKNQVEAYSEMRDISNNDSTSNNSPDEKTAKTSNTVNKKPTFSSTHATAPKSPIKNVTETPLASSNSAVKRINVSSDQESVTGDDLNRLVHLKRSNRCKKSE